MSITKDFPQYQLGWKILGSVLRQTDRIEEAINANKKAVEISPQDADAHNNLGISYKAMGKFSHAKERFLKAISLRQNYPEAYNNLGAIYQALGKFVEAEKSFLQAIALKPYFSEAYNNLGVTLKALKKYDEAEKIYLKAISIKPDNARAYFNLGIIHTDNGKFDEARACYINAIDLKPNFAAAYRLLAQLKEFHSYDGHLSKMLEQYSDKNISDINLCHINFALAKAFEDLGDFEKAFKHYSEGNAQKRKYLNYDSDKTIKYFDGIKSHYSTIYSLSSSIRKSDSDKPFPIFIIGMPRSGTTLVEQIISCHSLITAGGELPYAFEFGEDIAIGSSKINSKTIFNFKKNYLEKLKSICNHNFFVTDKLPENFLLLGLLSVCFPDAKIIHVTRNPSAVCWSNFKLYSSSKNHNYSHSLSDIASYYKLYTSLMKFWMNKIPNRIYNLKYELLTANPEAETRKLIKAMHLDWEDGCLSPHDNLRSVATASNIQVRRKIYQGSSEEWKKYEPYLKGIFDFYN